MVMLIIVIVVVVIMALPLIVTMRRHGFSVPTQHRWLL
jgi:hypothetical protein